MRRIDYYAPQGFRVPKWLGATLGGIFAAIAVGCALVIAQLVQPVHAAPAPVPPPAPVAAAAVAAPVAPPTPSVQAEPSAPVAAAAPAPAEEAPAPVVAHTHHHHHHAAKKHSHHAVVAKRDARPKKSGSSKSDLDRLLGL
jgi:hypothetical protein